MKLKPLSDCVLIKQDVEKLSSIIIVESNKKLSTGVILAVGQGKKLPNGNIDEMYLKVNDHIMFGEYSGQPVTVDGESYLIMRQPDVIGILDE